ncbi:MAG: leucine-rich repeat protein [Clostridia bacterium]|nr:leucine-rich repeat protein [Clostridia bacterium]MBR6640725.1 leucine-rich repeat protein [Clostridia bacterium]
MQNKKGISLIVLVITIIVMIILAASVVITLSNTGVIDRAGQAVDLTNEAAVQDLAALTWADAYMNNKRGTELVNEVTTKLSEQGVTAEKWNITISDTGVVIKSKDSSSSEETLATKYNWTRTGICGETNYGFDETTGTLGIWGSGAMDTLSLGSETNIKTVIIEEGVTSISASAFRARIFLEEVIIPASVTRIGSFAFANCSSLTDVQYLGLQDPLNYGNAFNGCSKIIEVEVPDAYAGNTFAGMPIK